jgi:hypothetical protein
MTIARVALWHKRSVSTTDRGAVGWEGLGNRGWFIEHQAKVHSDQERKIKMILNGSDQRCVAQATQMTGQG